MEKKTRKRYTRRTYSDSLKKSLVEDFVNNPRMEREVAEKWGVPLHTASAWIRSDALRRHKPKKD